MVERRRHIQIHSEGSGPKKSRDTLVVNRDADLEEMLAGSGDVEGVYGQSTIFAAVLREKLVHVSCKYFYSLMPTKLASVTIQGQKSFSKKLSGAWIVIPAASKLGLSTPSPTTKWDCLHWQQEMSRWPKSGLRMPCPVHVPQE
jgi:hypothetical protein